MGLAVLSAFVKYTARLDCFHFFWFLDVFWKKYRCFEMLSWLASYMMSTFINFSVVFYLSKQKVCEEGKSFVVKVNRHEHT